MMNLQQLQNNLAALIKSRDIMPQENNDYLNKVKLSENLLLIKKIALWWRQTQIEQFCLLTSNLLKIRGELNVQVANFISENTFSAFREEVGIQFLNYIISKNAISLIQSIAAFELAIIKLKLGERVECIVTWEYEPYTVIRALLRNTFNIEEMNKGNYKILISFRNKEELFKII